MNPLLFFLFSQTASWFTVIQGQDGWGVTYSSTEICALKGSTVDMSCTYRYPSTVQRVENMFWFRTVQNENYMDLKNEPGYSGRVQYDCINKDCSLRITDLRESDSAEYKFRFITNQPDPDVQVIVRPLDSSRVVLQCHSSCLPDRSSYIWYKSGRFSSRTTSPSYSVYTDPVNSYSCAFGGFEDFPSPLVCVDALQVQVTRITVHQSDTEAELKCHSSCSPAARLSYVWFKNGQKVTGVETSSFKGRVYPGDIISCALKGHENYGSPPVSKYTWYKENGDPDLQPLSKEPQLVFSSIQSSDSGEYYCTAENELWGKMSKYIYVNVKLIQGQDGWGVTYSSTEICAFKGSTVNMSCTYRHPSTVQRVENRFWYTKVSDGVYTHLTTDPQYSGRVQYIFGNKDCTLRITDLRESDSAEYKFRFITDQEGGTYTGKPGVTLRVTDLQVRVNSLQASTRWAELMCHSRCPLPGHPHYVWYKNEQIIQGQTSSYSGSFTPADSFSCAVAGHENCRSPPLYTPRLPSVSVSPSAEIVEGSSVTLTCSSDANPAANYTWYKENQTLIQGPERIYNFSSISSEDRGNYYCKSENQYGEINSSSLFIDVQYAPRLPSVSVSPSAEIVEGSSVTLTCSSDANPAANYTWYKENGDSPKASGQIFTITDFRAEHSGNYYCEVQNRRGRHNSTLQLTVSPRLWKSAVIKTTPVVILAIIGLALFVLIRKNRAAKQSPQRGDEPDNRTQEQDDLQYASVLFSTSQTDVYSNIRPAGHHRHEEGEEEEGGVKYAAVRFTRAGAAPRSRGPETVEDPSALYSTVNKQNR
ncbi:B-cell receptor CD22-like [Acanthopagrus schlegelii]